MTKDACVELILEMKEEIIAKVREKGYHKKICIPY